jgi:hypothetical protein
MDKGQKDLLRYVVSRLRHTLAGTVAIGGEERGDLDRELERLGVAPSGEIAPIDALPNPSLSDRRARHVAEAELAQLPPGERAMARTELVERAAYSWINRLLALRALEARGLIDETLRHNPDYNGVSEALFVLRDTEPTRTNGPDGGWWAVVDDACATQAVALPGLFAPDDPSVALRPSTAALLRCIDVVGGGALSSGATLDALDAAFADPDAIGWAYQFYQEEAKAEIYRKLKEGGKVETRDEIAAATQLFTEPYMVQWLLQNSLGRSYHELFPYSTLPDTWVYYIRTDKLDPPAFTDLRSLTVMDPCAGSGHFLREAFDMLIAMYREQQPELSAKEIADRILTTHLHGIDIDPRASQLTALTLYLRACELVRDEQRSTRKPGTGSYQPPAMNIATTPTGLDPGALDRHLRRHPQDRILKPLLEGIFAALEQADILGSLLRPAQHLSDSIATLQRLQTIPMDFDADETTLRRTIMELAKHDPKELERVLLERIAASFHSEEGERSDVAAQLFGMEAERGVRLLQLLDRKYAVVVTNPPYMGSKHMDTPLKKYVEGHYSAGKRDLYAACILRCLELSRDHGRVAMVTQQSWMFRNSFADLRAVTDEQPKNERTVTEFTGLLRQTRIEQLAHLGEHAFEDSAAAGAFVAMFTLRNHRAKVNGSFCAVRLVGLSSPTKKRDSLREISSGMLKGAVYQLNQEALISVPEAPIVYWLRPRFFDILKQQSTLQHFADVVQGLATGVNSQYLRAFWEVGETAGWVPYQKGGGFCRWFGLGTYCIDWREAGARLHANPRSVIRNPNYFFQRGLTYSYICRGSMNTRVMTGSIFDVASMGVFPKNPNQELQVLGLLNSRITSWLLRTLSQNLMFQAGTTSKLPVPKAILDSQVVGLLSASSLEVKTVLERQNLVEDAFSPSNSARLPLQRQEQLMAILHSVEGELERVIFESYALNADDERAVCDETGVPAGWFPLLTSYDSLDGLSMSGKQSLPEALTTALNSHRRNSCDPHLIAETKQRLRSMYEAGRGAINAGWDEEEASSEAGGEGLGVTYLPIPTETFLEELSQKLRIHPISVYWLLQELRDEGVRCKPEELRQLEDRLSVLVLRLLGHRWPKQIEAEEPVPGWADADGIVPLISSTDEMPMVDRIRARLREEDGDLGAQQTEALLAELTGLSLEDWLRSQFFPRHVRQFKYRPIAWQLVSRPPSTDGKKRGGGRRLPAFECLLYYHACDTDVLARMRTQYVEPLMQIYRSQVERARQANDETAAAIALDRVQEMEAFVAGLRTVEEQGFTCDELAKILAKEPLDRWSGDGFLSPVSTDELLHGEQAWRVDINDGVRVNIAPLQLAGLLASDVLKVADARKAIADRARWRADERRWVREGKLPRCGWMPEDVPESPRWTELAPQREADARKLEQKRRETLAALQPAPAG